MADYLPFEDHLDDDVVLMKNEAVLAMFAVDGVCPDTADEADIKSWYDALHNAWRNIGAEDIELTTLECRAELDEETFYPPGAHSIDYAAELETAYREGLLAGTMYENSLFLAVQVHPPNIIVRGIAKLVSDPQLNDAHGLEDRIDRMSAVCGRMQTQLAAFGLRRLGYIRRDTPVFFDEIAEALVFAATGVRRQIGATTGRMGNAMFSENVRFRGIGRNRYIEFDGPARPTYAAMFAFSDYPIGTWPGMFHSLTVAPYRCTVAQSFRFLSNSESLALATRKQNKRVIAGDKAKSQTEKLDHLMEDLLDRDSLLGDHSLSYLAFAGSKRALDNVSHAAWRDLAACGLVATRMGGTLKAGWLSLFPGGASYRPRPGHVSSRNFVAFAPLYNWPTGQEMGHWPGPPIITFRTLGGTAFRFHWHVRDVGNTLITGNTGSGKTTMIGMLNAMTAGRARIIGFDHKQGWKFLVRRMAGDYAVLGEEPHCNAFKGLTATQVNIAFLIDLWRGAGGGHVTEEEQRRLALGVYTIMTALPPPKRNAGELRAFFPDDPEGFGARLEKWIWPHGELGWVLDAPVETVSFGRLSIFDTTALLSNERARGPALAYLFYRISLLLDGSPTLIPVDEGWQALLDPYFSSRILNLARTIRSKGGALVFITQSPEDLNQSGIGKVLMAQCESRLHLADPHGKRDDYVGGFDLTAGQWDAFHQLQGGQGLALLIQGTKSAVVQMPMRSPKLQDHLPILSAPESALTRDNVHLLEAAE